MHFLYSLKTLLWREIAVLLLLIVIIEIGLRIVPEAIPLPLLAGFEYTLRQSIAEKRHLPNEEEMQTFTTDEGGTLSIFKPFSVVETLGKDPGAVGVITTDAMGFCNPSSLSYEKKHIDILTLGNSVTWCTTVDASNTWSSILGDITGKSIWSLGQPGIGPYQELSIFKYFGAKKSPGIVIMGIAEGTDLRNVVEATQRKELEEKGETQTSILVYPCRIHPDFICTLHRQLQYGTIGTHSYTYNIVAALAKIIVDSIGKENAVRLEKGAGVFSNFQFTVSLEGGDTLLFNPENQNVDELGYPERARRSEVSFEAYTRALEEFGALSEKNNFTPVLLYIPSVTSVYAPHITYKDNRAKDLLAWFSEAQRKFLRQKADELGILFIDPTLYLEDIGKDTPARENLLYFYSNLHPTPRAYALLAEFTKTTLTKKNILE